jgi:chromosome segregation ATPase
MTEAEETELAMWDARCNDLQNSLERVREERDDLKELAEQLTKQINVATEYGHPATRSSFGRCRRKRRPRLVATRRKHRSRHSRNQFRLHYR